MKRRDLLKRAGALPFLALPLRARAAPAMRRVRPGDPDWPDAASWEAVNRQVGGRLIKVQSPLQACAGDAGRCADLFKALKNPYYIGDEPGLTQTLGWVDAWTSQPSAYAVAARSTADVVAAVNFARERNLRLVVKGGGHSYLGTSNAPDSLLVWTRPMNAIALHDAFVPAGCATDPQPAATIGAGAIWAQAYDAVTTKGGRYVQGGGCLTVGVAGLIQSGGFGSFSKGYGTAAASLLEAELVTADGAVRIANACTHPDLFWAIKGGGGGSFGVVTRVTVRTHELPEFLGSVSMTIRATSDDAFRRLIAQIMGFHAEHLLNPHWGEKLVFAPGNVLAVRMLYQGLDRQQAETAWRPFFDWVAASPRDFQAASPPAISVVPARKVWDAAFLKTIPGVVTSDDRPGAPEGNIFWSGDNGETGQFLYGFESAWLPAALLRTEQRPALVDALFAATRHWTVSLHFNKGLAGAPAAAIAAARDTATNPAVLDAFALAIIGAGGPPSYPGIVGREPDLTLAHERARAASDAMNALRRAAPNAGAYVSESNFFDESWQRSYWGDNYGRLLAVKDKYDADGLFIVHHGVGSERWSADGFARLN